MNYQIVDDFPHPIFTSHQNPCVSVFMTTHPEQFDHKKDMLVFKNLVKSVTESLEQSYPMDLIESFKSRLNIIEGDVTFFQHAKKGLVLYMDAKDFIIYFLDSYVEELAVVSNSFHIKPLISYYQELETYHLLFIDGESFRLFEGNAHDVIEVFLPKENAITFKDLLRNEQNENNQTDRIYGDVHHDATFHGHSMKNDEEKIERLKYFKYIDGVVLYHFSKIKEIPLILATQQAYQFDFREISKNPYLLDKKIIISKQEITQDIIEKIMLDTSQEHFETMMNELIDTYHMNLNKDLSSDQLIIILKALLEARVDILWIEKDKLIPGKIDLNNYQIITSPLSDPNTDDLLDDMVEYGLKVGTKIYLLEKEKMPTTSGLAAIFRY